MTLGERLREALGEASKALSEPLGIPSYVECLKIAKKLDDLRRDISAL